MPEEQVVPVEEAAVETPVEETPTEEVVEEVAVETTVDTIPTPKKKSAQERIDELTRKRRDAERDAEYWRQVALGKKAPEPAPAPDTPTAPQRPVISQFETTEQYEDALLEWHTRKRDIEATTRKQKDEQEENLRRFDTAAAEARKKYPDFDDVVEAPVFSPQMRKSIFTSEMGPEIAYFLGQPENRDTANKIRTMPPERQYIEMGKLETRLSLAQRTKKVPQAPAPIKPVGISGSGGEPDPSKMSTAEWIAWDRKMEFEKLKKKLE